ncbi:MAG: ATP synthase subunit I [Deltaproteobacteria bacterium]|nr:ATP synthase subunit I [Deltaproteobacteria bacterium]
MPPTLHFIQAVLAGLAAGGLYFMGLWWTINHMAESRSPFVLTAASFLVRAAVAVGTIVWAGRGQAPLILTALGAFLAARVAASRMLSPSRLRTPSPKTPGPDKGDTTRWAS